jgi:hypothetical protein
MRRVGVAMRGGSESSERLGAKRDRQSGAMNRAASGEATPAGV